LTNNYAVLIPTYNNEKTLSRVLDGVLSYTPDVIVVNDGSTDSTAAILSGYPQVEVVTFPKNKGKGKALQEGFQVARAKGYTYVLTIDSDGQHFPEDIPTFITAIEQEEVPTLLVGDRDMTVEGVPKKSSFGHKFSNFWFHLETGVKLPDTQSGYRLYPLEVIPRRYFTSKFEFEIEVLVRSSWRGVPIKPVPIRVLYDPSERVSHFRPVKDFARISLLNSILVLIAFLYIKPRDFLRKFQKKSFKTFLKEDLLETSLSDSKKAFSIALGAFFGISPLWGFQTALTITFAVLLGLNKSLAFLASNISIPPMIPLIVWSSLKVGGLFTGGGLLPEGEITRDFIKAHLIQYLTGSFLLALLIAAILGTATYLFLKTKSEK
jgi:glycosyltransferase, family 2